MFKVKLRILLFLLATGLFAIFTIFSYTVAKESWQKIDFDTTVKLQDHISRRFDLQFSYFSLLGSVEATFTIAGILALIYLVRLKILATLAWALIIPASFVELFGKLVLFHPSPPVLFHRSILETTLPSFYIQTNFSYPSGHMIRTSFILTILAVLVIFGGRSIYFKLIALGCLVGVLFMMSLTRVYLGEHWTSDVIGGVMLGISTGLLASIFVLGKDGARHLRF